MQNYTVNVMLMPLLCTFSAIPWQPEEPEFWHCDDPELRQGRPLQRITCHHGAWDRTQHGLAGKKKNIHIDGLAPICVTCTVLTMYLIPFYKILGLQLIKYYIG